jgi:hypothetical protein
LQSFVRYYNLVIKILGLLNIKTLEFQKWLLLF